MILKSLEIDTTGDVNSKKYPTNAELFDIITPNIVALIDVDESPAAICEASCFDWAATRRYFDGDNGHYLVDSDGKGSSAAYEFAYVLVWVDNNSSANTLSELCDELATEHNIESWFKNKQRNS